MNEEDIAHFGWYLNNHKEDRNIMKEEIKKALETVLNKESEKESKILKTLEDAVNVIEHWKWNMYTDDDEVDTAVQSIKELIEELKNK